MPKSAAIPLHIFRAGKHTSSAGDPLNFSAADVAQIAANYDPAVYRAPLVVGHPKVDDPAYGWAASVSENGGELFADPTEVDPQFAEMVNAGRFKNISVALWPAGHPGNPKPEGYYLKHIGFLGATAPAVKGLKPANFNDADADKVLTIEFAAEDGRTETLMRRLVHLFTNAVVGVRVPSFSVSEESNTMDATELAAREAAVAAREIEFAERDAKALRDQAAAVLATATASAVEFAEGIAKTGTILPTQKAAVVAALVALHGAPVVTFGEAGSEVTQSPADALREVLTNKPAAVDFRVKTPKPASDVQAGRAVNFNAPDGMTVDPDRAALHSLVLEYADANKVSYADALTVVVARQKAAK